MQPTQGPSSALGARGATRQVIIIKINDLPQIARELVGFVKEVTVDANGSPNPQTQELQLSNGFTAAVSPFGHQNLVFLKIGDQGVCSFESFGDLRRGAQQNEAGLVTLIEGSLRTELSNHPKVKLI